MNRVIRLCCLAAIVYTLLPAAPAFALLDPLTVSPTAPRHPSDEREPGAHVDIAPDKRAAFLDRITVEDTTESLKLSSTLRLARYLQEDGFEEVRVPAGTVAKGPGGATLELKAIGVFYPRNSAEAAPGEHPYAFYTLKGEPLDDATVAALLPKERERTRRIRQGAHLHAPSAKLVFAGTGLDDARHLRIRVRDARTKYIFVADSEYLRANDMAIGIGVPAWHQAPLELLVDYSFPPLEVREIDAKPGQTASFPDFDIRYLGMLTAGSWSERMSIGSMADSTMRHSIQIMKTPLDGAGTPMNIFSFGVVPQARTATLSIDVLNGEGTVVGTGDEPNCNYGGLATFHISGAIPPPARFRIRQRTKLVRFVFELPELPGLPEQNRGVTDLLDVVVPYARFESEFDLPAALRYYTQMSIDTADGSYTAAPPDAFPREVENVTVRALLHDYAKQQGPYRVYTDPEKESIIIETPDKPGRGKPGPLDKVKALF